eukprot:m.137475 g.137475  ORF g.137475 m.137475 type:complete len:310 (+) comp9930_c0_seq1:157-1086(+)
MQSEVARNRKKKAPADILSIFCEQLDKVRSLGVRQVVCNSHDVAHRIALAQLSDDLHRALLADGLNAAREQRTSDRLAIGETLCKPVGHEDIVCPLGLVLEREAKVIAEPAHETELNIVIRKARIGFMDEVKHSEFQNATAETPVEELTRVSPAHNLRNAALELHALRRVVQRGKLDRDLMVHRSKRLVALIKRILELSPLRRISTGSKALGKRAVALVQALHGHNQGLLAVLNLDSALGLQDTAASLVVSIHFHGTGIDGGIDDHPCATAELTVRWNVHKHRLLVLPQIVDNHGTKLKDLVIHVAHAT